MELLALMFTDITNEKLCGLWTYVNKVQSSCLKCVSTLRYIEDVLHKCAYAGDIEFHSSTLVCHCASLSKIK